MKIACTNMMIPGGSLTEKAKKIADIGFDGISVFEEIDSWTPEKEEELLSLEANTGIVVCEFCFSGNNYGKLMDEDADVAAQSKKFYGRSIGVGNKLGSVSEMEYQYAAQDPIPLFEPYKKMNPGQLSRFCKIYASLASQTANGSCILLEPINRYESPYLNNLADNAAIVEELNLPNTGLLFDTFHVSIEEVDICTAFRKYAHLIRHVHLGDNNRLLPGRGNLPWPQFFDTMNELGYGGYANIECAVIGEDVLKQLEKALSFIRAIS